MTDLFISDLHLGEHRPDLTAAFLSFLQTRAVSARALYILGDLFEFWIGDDECSPLQQEIAAALAALAARGVAIYYLHGNRDFMIGPRYARAANMTLLPEITPLVVSGRQAVLLHGDLLCTLDTAYQRFRRITSWRWLRWIFLRLPLAKRLKIADQMRQGKQGKAISVMDVTPEAVTALMQQHNASLMIHGHTHRPAIHELPFSLTDGHSGQQQQAQRIVLGDWDTHLSVLEADDNGVTLQRYPLGE